MPVLLAAAAVGLTGLTQALLFADRLIHDMYGFQINGFVIDLVLTPGGIAARGAGEITVTPLSGLWHSTFPSRKRGGRMGEAQAAASRIDFHLILILGIMIATGLLGGIANFFLNERDSNAPWGTAAKYMVLGVVAALTVPLFLNMMSSHLLEATRLKSSELFVFAGFCLLYVVVSRRFFENIAAHLLRQVEQVRREVKHLQLSNDRSGAPAASLAAARLSEAEPASEPAPASIVELPRNAVSFGDIELMRAIGEGNAIYGANTGLAAKTTLPKDQVAPRLAALKAMGLIESKIDERNVVRWYLTPKGRSLIDGINAAASLEEKRDAS